MKVKSIIPLVSLVVGVIWVFYGLSNHGFWHPIRGPISGFLPILAAGTLAAVSLIGLIQSFKEQDEPDRLESWSIVLAATITFALIFIIGMYAALLIFLLVWLRFYEKASWKHTIICLVVAFAIVFGAFGQWLQVPFPRGMVLNFILGY